LRTQSGGSEPETPPSPASETPRALADPNSRGRLSEVSRQLRGWLRSGPIQSPSGAFYAWIDEPTGQPAFEYPEITGYALTYLAGRPELGSDELDRAHRAAEWLLDRLGRDELGARAGWDRGAAYNFDLAMIATGLICFGRRRENEPQIEAGIELAAMLATSARQPQGLTPITAGPLATSRSGWSAEGRPHLCKAVQCLLAAAAMGFAAGRDAASRLIENVSGMQQDDGSFRTQPHSGGVMLHPHLYAVEGMWMWASAEGDPSAAERARRASNWVWEQQLPSGGFPRSVGSAEGGAPVEQCDVTAQAIRMAAALGSPPEGFGEAVRRLAELADPAPGGAALVYQPEATARHHNAWTTMFGAQAIEWTLSGPTEWTTLV
jgi:hypothetical protein